MVYGIAMHKFIDVMFKTKGNMEASTNAMYEEFRVPKVDDHRSMYLSDEMHLCTTAFHYWHSYILKDSSLDIVILEDGLPATEVTFEILYYEDDFIKVYLCGTLDKIVKIRNGCYAIGDYKTTRQDPAGRFLDDFEMSQQLRFYVLSLKLMAQLKPESILGKIGQTNIGVFIEGIFLKEKFSEMEFKRSDVWQSNYLNIPEFQHLLDNKIADLSNLIALVGDDTDYIPQREGIFNGSCKPYNKLCEFWNVCRTNHPVVSQNLLDKNFRTVEYNPMKHNE
jgi:hypothetical protein